jgi:hypothetical protein
MLIDVNSLGDASQKEDEMSESTVSMSENSSPGKRKTWNKAAIVADSQVKRSPRIKEHKKGYKNPQCQNKNCLGCNATPPVLTAKAIRKLGSSLCDMDPESMSDVVLSKKKKTVLVGPKPSVEPPQAEDDDDDVSTKL